MLPKKQIWTPDCSLQSKEDVTWPFKHSGCVGGTKQCLWIKNMHAPWDRQVKFATRSPHRHLLTLFSFGYPELRSVNVKASPSNSQYQPKNYNPLSRKWKKTQTAPPSPYAGLEFVTGIWFYSLEKLHGCSQKELELPGSQSNSRAEVVIGINFRSDNTCQHSSLTQEGNLLLSYPRV